MSYIRKVISENEHLVLLTRLHWIFLIEGILWCLCITAVGFVLDHYLVLYADRPMFYYDLNIGWFHFDRYHTPVPLIFFLIGLMMLGVYIASYLSNEIGLTNRRIIHKKGVMMIEIQQVELEDIRGEAVYNGWLGWLLGYGRIHFDCRFIDDVYLPVIANPYRLVKAVHTARMRHEKIAYGEKDLDADLERINADHMQKFKAYEKMRKMGQHMRLDFRKVH